MSTSTFDHPRNRVGNWLQLFADTTTPVAEGNPLDEGEQKPKTYTAEELQTEIRKATDAAAAKARRSVEAEYKPRLDEAQKAVDAAKPFLDNPTGYMTQYLAQNPQALQTVADGVDRMMKGEAPTQAQIAAVGKAADAASDPRIAQKLEALEAQMKGVQESVAEERELKAELKAYAQDAKESGLDWDEDAFKKFIDAYATENDIGDDDPIDTKLLFRLWKAENKDKPKPRAPRLPGASPTSTGGSSAAKPKSWEEAGAQAEARLRTAQQD
jgi:hypothetical protein